MSFYHTFHIVTLSPWPLLAAAGALSLISSFCILFKFAISTPVLLSIITVVVISFLWWRDVTRESLFLGDHTYKVQDGLKWGIALFIISEVLFFLAWFWAFFHASIVPVNELGSQWPPLLINSFNPFSVPLLNTAILLASGVFVTWSHHSMVTGNSLYISLTITIILGAIFTGFQAFEYIGASFSISDGAYGTTFFVSTGFHGLHVLIGTVFLIVCLMRSTHNQFVYSHHVGFEFALWYWHFVDVVWLFLFSFIYWWGW